jgi:hypothetical protein
MASFPVRPRLARLGAARRGPEQTAPRTEAIPMTDDEVKLQATRRLQAADHARRSTSVGPPPPRPPR